MGAPKQKWTAEEESALRAGISKHGAGKWRTILKDPEFSGVLYLRSNVDLKDKWRNMSVMANGWGSREKARLALKRMQSLPKNEETAIVPMTVDQSDEEMVDTQLQANPRGSPQTGVSKRSIIRLDNLITEAINSLKEPGGSNKTTIAEYIEEQYWAPPNFKRLLSAKLKFLTVKGKLVKAVWAIISRLDLFFVRNLYPRRYFNELCNCRGEPDSAIKLENKRKYRIASPSALLGEQSNPPLLALEGIPAASPQIDKGEKTFPTKAQIDWELAKMRNMTPDEAAAAAAQAVAEAEAAIAEAEEAAREAEAAEADAEAAQAFAEAAMKTLKGRTTPLGMMVRA